MKSSSDHSQWFKVVCCQKQFLYWQSTCMQPKSAEKWRKPDNLPYWNCFPFGADDEFSYVEICEWRLWARVPNHFLVSTSCQATNKYFRKLLVLWKLRSWLVNVATFGRAMPFVSPLFPIFMLTYAKWCSGALATYLCTGEKVGYLWVYFSL